jgi:GTP-binding protein LepA
MSEFMSNNIEQIRNFCIVAHIDHGKSTLADRLLEVTGTIEKRLMKPQYLDQLELERERGITIKMAPVRMIYKVNHSQFSISNFQFPNKFKIQNSKSLEIRNSDLEIPDPKFILNLIDTPGHSDFSYEVSRALAAVEGAMLLVDATQGIQAQTLANFEFAKKSGLTIIGAVNKIDIASSEQIESAVNELSALLEVSSSEILRVSGKTGHGVLDLLETTIKKIPAPRTLINADQNADKRGYISVNQLTNQRESAMPARALVFDSLYDEHKGIIAFVRVFNGEFSAEGESASGGKTNMCLLATNTEFKAKEVGYFAPELKSFKKLQCGEIGYIATGLKDPGKLKIGDTIISNLKPKTENLKQFILPGYKEPKPVVFVSFYPEDSNKYEELKKALAKLKLTDAALQFESDFNEVLGRGFKGGFLGRLHFEITAERLAREFGMATVNSFPSVAYKAAKNKEQIANSKWIEITNPKDFSNDYLEAQEPMTKVEILASTAHLGPILELQEIFRFSNIETKTLGNKIIITAKLPLADLIRDLDDKLKSVSQGFASLNYEVIGFEKAEVEKLDVLLNGQLISGLTRILPKNDIEREARITVERLKELLPKQQFSQAIQAAVGTRIIARENIPASRKDVTDYLYGGDRTRKMKLWKKQQRGKKKLKELASQNRIKIPAGVFKELLKK